MKKIIAIFVIIIGITACERPPEFPELPEETQTGSGIFGCLVNGELVIPFEKGYYDISPGYANYDRTTHELTLFFFGQNKQRFKFNIIAPKQGMAMPMDTVMYFPQGQDTIHYYGGTHIGEILISRFDTLPRVVSGRFLFAGYKSLIASKTIVNSADYVTVTKGRFDVRMNLNN